MKESIFKYTTSSTQDQAKASKRYLPEFYKFNNLYLASQIKKTRYSTKLAGIPKFKK